MYYFAVFRETAGCYCMNYVYACCLWTTINNSDSLAPAFENCKLKFFEHSQKDLIDAEIRKKDEILEIERKNKNSILKMSEKYLKIIERKNYEVTYPKPAFLRDHQIRNPRAFYIQILGCRGVGKSTFLNRFFQLTGLRNNSNNS